MLRSTWQATHDVKAAYSLAAEMELDKGRVWDLKTFTIFPWLIKLTQLDHIFRVICTPDGISNRLPLS